MFESTPHNTLLIMMGRRQKQKYIRGLKITQLVLNVRANLPSFWVLSQIVPNPNCPSLFIILDISCLANIGLHSSSLMAGSFYLKDWTMEINHQAVDISCSGLLVKLKVSPLILEIYIYMVSKGGKSKFRTEEIVVGVGFGNKLIIRPTQSSWAGAG